MKYTASVKGGLFAQYAGTLGSVDVYTNAKDHRRIAQELSHKKNMEMRGLIDTLVGVAPGATAAVHYYEIEPNVDMGGRRNIIDSLIINRATTAQDVTDIKETITSLSTDTFTPNPVYNGDRNPLGTR